MEGSREGRDVDTLSNAESTLSGSETHVQWQQMLWYKISFRNSSIQSNCWQACPPAYPELSALLKIARLPAKTEQSNFDSPKPCEHLLLHSPLGQGVQNSTIEFGGILASERDFLCEVGRHQLDHISVSIRIE